MEKLTEETLRDWTHLQELLSICEGKVFLDALFPYHGVLLCISVYYFSSKTNRRDLTE